MRQHLAPQQRQVMTFALHQALKILQMPQLELAEWIEGEIERNPLLERIDTRHSPLSFETPAIATLRDELLAQARDNFPAPRDLALATLLIDTLDEKGWLTTPLEELGPPLEDLERILATLHTFDPPGIGARTLQEALLLQLRAQPYSLAEILVREHFQDLLQNRFSLIQKKLRLSASDLQEALHRLSRLTTRPGAAPTPTARPLVADLTLKRVDHGWILEAGEEELPLFHIKEEYLELYPTLPKGAEKDTLRSWITSAKWLQRCLKRRRQTLCHIGRFLIRRQALSEGACLDIHDLAQALRVHVSTAWRAISGKTLASPRGFVPLPSLFSHKICPAKELLRAVIQQEDKARPLTDEELAGRLQQQGHPCARRTIAKYRKLLQIGSAAQRKAFG